MKTCENCEKILEDVEKLRVELTETRDKYSQICERLWKIVYKKRK